MYSVRVSMAFGVGWWSIADLWRGGDHMGRSRHLIDFNSNLTVEFLQHVDRGWYHIFEAPNQCLGGPYAMTMSPIS